LKLRDDEQSVMKSEVYDEWSTSQASLTKIFLVFAEIGLPVPTYPRIRTTKLFNLIVFWRLWTKQFSTLVKHLRDCWPWKIY